MKLSLTALIVATGISVCLAAPQAANTTEFFARAPRDVIPSNGWFALPAYGGGTVHYLSQGGGRFSIQWSGDCDFTAGVGRNPGSSRGTISYNGTYQPSGNSYLTIYGWTRNPLIEYYIVESYGSSDPSLAAQKKGSVTCNGANYDILSTVRYDQPSIDGTQTFAQFWSVRNPKQTPGGTISGSVDLACHSSAWRNYGMNLGSQHNIQAVAVAGYYSSGSATITVS